MVIDRQAINQYIRSSIELTEVKNDYLAKYSSMGVTGNHNVLKITKTPNQGSYSHVGVKTYHYRYNVGYGLATIVLGILNGNTSTYGFKELNAEYQVRLSYLLNKQFVNRSIFSTDSKGKDVADYVVDEFLTNPITVSTYMKETRKSKRGIIQWIKQLFT